MQASLALAALELALAALEMAIGRQQITPGELIHHSDRGVQPVCLRRVCRTAGAGRHSTEHEPFGMPVGQCDGGELDADIEEGGG